MTVVAAGEAACRLDLADGFYKEGSDGRDAADHDDGPHFGSVGLLELEGIRMGREESLRCPDIKTCKFV